MQRTHHLRVRHTLLRTKRAGVVIDARSACSVCHKPIQDKWFSVLPRAVQRHPAAVAAVAGFHPHVASDDGRGLVVVHYHCMQQA